MDSTITQAKQNFLQAQQLLTHALTTTPDDRINWSPSPTSRTPVQIVAHAADAVKNLHKTFQGDTFAVPTPTEADKGFRDWERQFSTREEVLGLLDENCHAYVAWLDALSPDQLDSMVKLPFDLGSAPLRMALAFPAMHTQTHVAQIEYIQTIYGDHDWHMNN